TNPQNSLVQTLENSGNAPAIVVYTLTPILGDCEGESFTLTVIVQPSPGITFSLPDQMVCTGTATEEVTIVSEVAGASFTWVSRSNGVEGVAVSGNNVIPSQSLTNPTREPIEIGRAHV